MKSQDSFCTNGLKDTADKSQSSRHIPCAVHQVVGTFHVPSTNKPGNTLTANGTAERACYFCLDCERHGGACLVLLSAVSKGIGSKYWNEWLTFPVQATDVKEVESTPSPLRISTASLTMHPRSGAKIECKHIPHLLIAIAASSNWTGNLVSNTPGLQKRRSHGRF